MESKLLAFILMFWAIFTALGITYLTIANSYGDIFTGTLISAKTITRTSCSNSKHSSGCSYTYYVGETFSKDNSTNTCLIVRLTPYYFQGDADNIVANKILYTQRTIWTTWYNAGTCYDQAIKNYYNIVGGVMISIAGLIFLFFLFGLCLDLIIYICDSTRSYSSNIQTKPHPFEGVVIA
jgi:hypothetical protein